MTLQWTCSLSVKDKMKKPIQSSTRTPESYLIGIQTFPGVAKIIWALIPIHKLILITVLQSQVSHRPVSTYYPEAHVRYSNLNKAKTVSKLCKYKIIACSWMWHLAIMVSDTTYWSEKKTVEHHIICQRCCRPRLGYTLGIIWDRYREQNEICFDWLVGWLVFQSLLQSLATKLKFKVFTRVSESNQYITNS